MVVEYFALQEYILAKQKYICAQQGYKFWSSLGGKTLDARLVNKTRINTISF